MPDEMKRDLQEWRIVLTVPVNLGRHQARSLVIQALHRKAVQEMMANRDNEHVGLQTMIENMRVEPGRGS